MKINVNGGGVPVVGDSLKSPMTRPSCVRCGNKDLEAQGFQFRPEGYVCCLCLVKEHQEWLKMLKEKPWEQMPNLQ